MIEIKKLENSEVEIKSEISAEIFESFREKALKIFSEKVEIDGFRKGHVPNAVVEKNIEESVILEKMAELALSENFQKIIKENNIDAIGYPRISITKIAKGNPLGFTILVSVMPEVSLPDYKKIAKDLAKTEEKVEVTDEDVKNTINHVREMRAKEEKKEIKDANDLPDIDDEYVKKLGDFKDLKDFEEKIRQNIFDEKTFRAKDKKRLEIIEKIIAESKLEVPPVLIEAESHKMLHRMKSDIENMGMKYEDYLKHLGKTEADLEKEWRTDAEKRAKLQIVVSEIAKLEKIVVSHDKIEAEVKRVSEIYKDVDLANAHAYVENVLQNEEVFQFLENQK